MFTYSAPGERFRPSQSPGSQPGVVPMAVAYSASQELVEVTDLPSAEAAMVDEFGLVRYLIRRRSCRCSGSALLDRQLLSERSHLSGDFAFSTVGTPGLTTGNVC